MSACSEKLDALRAELGNVIVGQKSLIDGMLIGLLSGGHVLLEGRPGLAKTLAVKTLAQCIGGSFSRIQFTPDLLPSDIVGHQTYVAEERRLGVELGPVSANLVLADEINRAPAKVQSALLEAMQERQVTIGGKTFALPSPYLVVATRNPLEQQGTYALPEAQKDRFLLEIRLDYLNRADELSMMERMSDENRLPDIHPVMAGEEILSLQRAVNDVHVDSRLAEYALDLVVATRPGQRGEMSERQTSFEYETDVLIEHGVSPRGSLGLLRSARARALLLGREHVLPEDIQLLAVPVLAHRIIRSFEAEARGLTCEGIVEELLERVKAP